mgnify:CR=1 FL=1
MIVFTTMVTYDSDDGDDCDNYNDDFVSKVGW